MDSFSHTPGGIPQPDATAEQALRLLRLKLEVDFTAPYTDQADPRHDLAVLVVDLARRFIDLRDQLRDRAEVDLVLLNRLNQSLLSTGCELDPNQDPPEDAQTARATALHARLAEVDRTLKLATVAYKQAWWSGTAAAGT